MAPQPPDEEEEWQRADVEAYRATVNMFKGQVDGLGRIIEEIGKPLSSYRDDAEKQRELKKDSEREK